MKRVFKVTIISFGFLIIGSFLLTRKARAWEMPRYVISTTSNIPGQYVTGVVEFKDGNGETRYVPLGQGQFSCCTSGGLRSYTAGKAYFHGWQCTDEETRRWYSKNSLSVPKLGSRTYASKKAFANYGCNEKPHHFRVLSDNWNCTEATRSPANSSCDDVVNVTLSCTATGPINSPPSVSVDKPGNCASSFTFTITATDQNGGGDVNQMQLNIGGNTFVINVSGSSAWLQNSTAGSLQASIPSCGGGRTACVSGNNVIVLVNVNGLGGLSGNVSVQAWARDVLGAGSVWHNAGTFEESTTPEVSMNVTAGIGAEVTLTWAITGGSPSPTKCWFDCTGGATCPNPVICSASPPRATGTVPGGGTYSFTFSAQNTCKTGTSTQSITVANPWLMTAFGDTYALGGYGGMAMQNVTGSFDGVPTGAAYFSSYIISKSGTSTAYPSRASKKNYLLGGSGGIYADNNRLKVGPTAEVYTYLYSLAEANDCFGLGHCTTTLPSPLGSCNGQVIYFLSNNVQITNDYTSAPTNACVFVVKGNVTISASVNRIDAFFLVDGDFVTQSSNRVLIIKGSVIANNVRFGRDLGGVVNNSNPSEIIIYDPKYLDILRDYLGEEYPYKIREYKYSR